MKIDTISNEISNNLLIYEDKSGKSPKSTKSKKSNGSEISSRSSNTLNSQGENNCSDFVTGCGAYTSQTSAGTNSVSCGAYSGNLNMGNSSVAIGYKAGESNMSNNSICINASGNALNADGGAGRCYINPIRGVAHGIGVGRVKWNSTTKEMTYSTN